MGRQSVCCNELGPPWSHQYPQDDHHEGILSVGKLFGWEAKHPKPTLGYGSTPILNYTTAWNHMMHLNLSQERMGKRVGRQKKIMIKAASQNLCSIYQVLVQCKRNMDINRMETWYASWIHDVCTPWLLWDEHLCQMWCGLQDMVHNSAKEGKVQSLEWQAAQSVWGSSGTELLEADVVTICLEEGDILCI